MSEKIQCIEKCNDCYNRTCEYHPSHYNPEMTLKVLYYCGRGLYLKDVLILVERTGIDDVTLKENK